MKRETTDGNPSQGGSSQGPTSQPSLSPRTPARAAQALPFSLEPHSAPVTYASTSDRLPSNKYKAAFATNRALEESKSSLDVTPNNAFVLETALLNTGEVVAQAAPQPIKIQTHDQDQLSFGRQFSFEHSNNNQTTKSLTNHKFIQNGGENFSFGPRADKFS